MIHKDLTSLVMSDKILSATYRFNLRSKHRGGTVGKERQQKGGLLAGGKSWKGIWFLEAAHDSALLLRQQDSTQKRLQGGVGAAKPTTES